jgi:hypothetical protein
MPDLYTIIAILGTLSAIGIVAWARHSEARARVLGALGRVHASNVKLSADWFDADRDTMTYDVEYTTRDGRRHSNRCKVAMHVGSDQGVYWERSLEGAA